MMGETENNMLMKTRYGILSTAFALFSLVEPASAQAIAPQNNAPQKIAPPKKAVPDPPVLALEIQQVNGRLEAQFTNNTMSIVGILLGKQKLLLKPGKIGTLPLLKREVLKIYQRNQNEEKFQIKHMAQLPLRIRKAQFLAPRKN